MARLLEPSLHHVQIDGTELERLRRAARLTQEQLAGLVRRRLNRDSFTRQYLAWMELPGKREVPTDIGRAVAEILQESWRRPDCK